MDSAAYAVLAISGWLAFLHRLRFIPSGWQSRSLRGMLLAQGSFALGVTFAVPQVAVAVNESTGVPNLAKLLAHTGVFAFRLGSEAQLLYWAYPTGEAWPRFRRLLITLGASYLGLVGLFSLGNSGDVQFTVEYAQNDYVAAYLILYIFSFMWYMVNLARLCARFGRIAERKWTRRGLWLIGMGAGIGLAYTIIKSGYLLAYIAGYHPANEKNISALLVLVAALLMTTGLTLPSVGPRIDSGRRSAQCIRAYRDLFPLWAAIYQAVPSIALHPPASLRRARWAMGNLDDRLLRLVIEIRDGQLALRGYLDPTTAQLARCLGERRGLSGDELQVAIEAACLAVAVRTKVDHRGPYSETEAPADTPSGGNDLASEVRHLRSLARAFAESPVVAEVLAQTCSEPPPSSNVGEQQS
jgi:hypothetical protein